MTESIANAQRRERWRSYFERTLLGPDNELEAATEAAMRAVARGEGQQAIIAAGLAAACAQRNGGGPSLRQPPRQTRTAAPPPAAPPPAAPPPGGAQQGAPQHAARPKRIWPPGSAVVGSIEKRTESMDGQFFQTWSFRLFRLEDGHRPVEPPIPVEMRGRSIVGQLAKGDVVVIPSGQHGRTRIVKSLHNLTTETTVEAKGRPFRRTRTLRRTVGLIWTVIGGILALAILAAIGFGIWFALGNGEIGLP
jgi:hypothetical protein